MSAIRWLAALACMLLLLVAGDVASEEIRARLDTLPFALLRMARFRLPAELRERVHDQEWVPELEHILEHARLFPVTRLITGLRFALGLVMRAGAVAAELLPREAPGPEHTRKAAARGLAGWSARVLRPLIWPAREPLWIRLYLAMMASAAVAAVGVSAAGTTMHAHDLELFLVLVACGLIAYRSLRVGDSPLYQGMQGVWILPVAVLLPPIYALIAPAPFIAVDEWRRPSYDGGYHRVFNIAVNGLAFGAASELAHTLAPSRAGHILSPGNGPLDWALVTIASGMLASAALSGFVLAVVKGSAPNTQVIPLLISRDAVRSLLIELCLGLTATFAAAAYPLLTILMIPAAILLNREPGNRHALHP